MSTTHNERGLVDEDRDGVPVLGWPAVASEAIHSLAHVTGGGEAIPAPTLYTVLPELAAIGHRLPQVLDQLGSGLARSLDQYDVREDDGSDPTETVARARAHMATAAAHARQAAAALDAAQNAIVGQSYRTTTQGES